MVSRCGGFCELVGLQAARRAASPADGFGGTAAGFGFAEPPLRAAPLFLLELIAEAASAAANPQKV